MFQLERIKLRADINSSMENYIHIHSMFFITKGYARNLQLRQKFKVPFPAFVHLIMKTMEIHAFFLSLLNIMQTTQRIQIIKGAVMQIYLVLQHVIV